MRRQGGPARRPRSRVGGLLGLLVLLAALAGLLAMHGLSDHGTAGHGTAMSPTASTGHVEPPRPSGEGPDVPSVEVPATGQATARAIGHAMDGMELCLAVLVAGLVLLIGAHLLRPSHLAPRRTGRLDGFRPLARPPDPPDLLGLSILRC